MGASPEGVLDLIGNAEEVTSDEWIAGPYDTSPASICAPSHPWAGLSQVNPTLRGGPIARFLHDSDGTTTMESDTGAFREASSLDPITWTTQPGGANGIGWRCVRDGRAH
jgi:hypothetical protein